MQVQDLSMSSRANWHTLMFCVIGLWVVIGVGLICAHGLGAPVAWWDLIHPFTIGALTTAIIVYSTHFTEALTRAATASYRAVAVRIGLVQVGLILLLFDRAGYDWGVISDVGATVVMAALALHIVAIYQALRGSLANHFASTVPFYIAASGFMMLAIVFAILAGHGVGTYSALIAAHQRTAVWGFAWLTVTATVITILPTVTGTKISAVAKTRATRSLVIHCVALGVSAGAFASGHPLIAAVAQLGVVAAAVMIFIPVVDNVLGGSPAWTSPSASITAGMFWLTALCAADAAVVAAGTHPRASTVVLLPAFLGAGLLQMVVGVLTFVTPTLRGGGPLVVKRGRRIAGYGWPARVTLINVGALLSVAGAVEPGVMMMAVGLVTGVLATVLSAFLPARRPTDVRVISPTSTLTPTPRTKR
nr:beta-carotene 15,15'-monooxygenase [Corynebacterium phocae]